jgi:UDP-3-O-[3-hydroxymyristoyl] glucosamine N-acyltransferase
MNRGLTLAELAKAADGAVRGPATVRVRAVAGVEDAGPDEITWVSHDKYAGRLAGSRAGAVVISAQFGETPMPAIVCEDPELGIARILAALAPPLPRPPAGVHASAVVDPSAKIGEGAAIGPLCVIGAGAAVGAGTVLHAQVFIGADTHLGDACELWPGAVVRERCRLGNRVILHPNVVVGSDGFGYRFSKTRHEKIPQTGVVEIEDDVEIGAGSCVDRAKFGATRIGRGTKIDNLVQIAHNVKIGANCVLVAQVGIAGSASLGGMVVLGGKVGVRDHVELGDGVHAAACCCISKDVPAGTVVNGIPAVPNAQYLREQAQVRRLPEWSQVMKDLLKRVERLEASTHD